MDNLNRYWQIAGQNQVWSGVSNSFVPLTDADFVAWLANGSVTVLASEEQLRRIFPKQTKFTPLEFKAKFTTDEWTAIRAARKTDDQVNEWYEEEYSLASYIDITNPLVAEALSLLVSKGLLTDARKTELLA